MGRDKLHFLALEAETGRPFYRPWGPTRLRQAAAGVPAEKWVRYRVDASDPAEAGWGVVFAEDADPVLRQALRPLLDRRADEAGERYAEIEARRGETVDRFRRRLQAGIGRVDPRRLPYYLLLVGDPEAIPFALQLDLGVQHAVGRIHGDADGLRRYAESVLAAESRPPRAAAVDFFSFDRPGDEPTRRAREDLVRPLAERFAGRAVYGRRATRERLQGTLLSGAPIVFTAGHSAVYRPDSENQIHRQGSPVTGEYDGEGSVVEHCFHPDDVEPAADLGGRVVYLYGCHTVGTPERDGFVPRPHAARPVLAPRPFVAPLARRLLLSTDDGGPGALAVIGQVDRAWPSHGLGWRGVRQIDAFEDVLAALGDGLRVGEALESFAQRYAEIAVALATAAVDHGPENVTREDLWGAFQDARSVALLGDPAVRLAVAGFPSDDPSAD